MHYPLKSYLQAAFSSRVLEVQYTGYEQITIKLLCYYILAIINISLGACYVVHESIYWFFGIIPAEDTSHFANQFTLLLLHLVSTFSINNCYNSWHRLSKVHHGNLQASEYTFRCNMWGLLELITENCKMNRLTIIVQSWLLYMYM